MKNILSAKNLIVSLAVVALVSVIGSRQVFASNCEANYGGGENCLINKRFEITKQVRIEGDSEWEDKVTDVSKNNVIEFKVKVKNLSDEKAGSFDEMKMKDFLPDELYRVGGDELSEKWDNFDPGETKTFIIKAKIDSDEFDRSDNFEKCVVNKAEARWEGKFEGSDTATVCYGKERIKELPKTGAVSDLSIIGIGLLTAGVLLRLSKKFAK